MHPPRQSKRFDFARQVIVRSDFTDDYIVRIDLFCHQGPERT
jgi:hypothetical protein